MLKLYAGDWVFIMDSLSGSSISREQLKVESLKKVTHLTSMGIKISFLNSVILVVFLIGVTPLSKLIIWLSSSFIINMARIIIQHKQSKVEITVDNVSYHLNIFLAGLFVSGCVWGAAGVFLLPYSSIVHQVFISFMLGGMVAGAVGVFATVMATFYVFTVPVIVPISIVFLQFGDRVHLGMCSMFFIFWFVMFIIARMLNRELIDFLRLKYENTGLVSNLEKEVAVRKKAEEELLKRNSEIESIVEKRTSELISVNGKLIKEIEERRALTDALEISEEKYRELANSLPQIVFEADEMGKITFANRNAFKTFGYEADSLDKGYNLLQMVVPEDREKVLRTFERLLGGETFVGNEYMALKKDGSRFPVASHADVIKKDGKNAGILGIAIDLTQKKKEEARQKELEKQLLRAQKMEALGTLAGGVAHDLNNILSGIVGYPDLLLMQLDEESPLRKPVITMQESGKRAAAIVQDLLTLTRRNVLVEKVVNLNDIIEEYLKSAEHDKLISFHSGVTLKTNLDKDLLNISGSPVHLVKTVMNLVSNAAEALPEGGNISIATENKYLDKPLKGYDEIAEGDYAVMRISDNGTGISSKDIDRVFEPFFTKKNMGKSGTGLGMTVVWGAVKDHNGYIDVESFENKGTTFSLYFPVTRDAAPADMSEDGLTLYMGKGEKIIVVDDVPAQLDIASAMLKQLGYSVDSFSSGEETVEYLKSHNADLIVLDMIMQPGMNGLETYKKILEIKTRQRAVIASGYSETLQVKETVKLGAGEYIKKPYTLITLAKAVRRELDKP